MKDKIIDAIGKIDDEYIEEAQNIKKKRFVFDWGLLGKILTGALCLFLLVMIVPNMFKAGRAMSKDQAYPEEVNGTEAFATLDSAAINYDNGALLDLNNTKLIKEDKKLIVTGNINIETLEFDNLLENLNKNIVDAGGYVQSSSINTNRNESRSYNASIRIPADKYNDFLTKTKQTGNVTWYNENIDDITTEYTDLTARVNSLKAEETKVLEFYDKAENLEELMSIEARLTQIRYEIDSIETSLKNYDLLTSYSTLNITVIETKVYTKTNDNFFSKLELSFKNGFTNFVNSIENFVLDVVYNIWAIIILVVLVIIAVVVVKTIRRKRK